MPAFFSKCAVAAVAFTVLLALATCALAASDSDKVVVQEFVDTVNTKAKNWVASAEQGSLSGATVRDLKRLCGVKGTPKHKAPRKVYGKSVESLPASFDAAEQWPNCPTITKIFDQAGCGSCWACSTTNALSDRFCTYGVNSNLYLSPSNVMECCWFCGSGCGGGQPVDSFYYAANTGVPTEQCQAYPFPKCAHHVVEPPLQPCQDHNTPNCPPDQCTFNASGDAFKRYYADQAWSLAGEADFMTELMTNGPFAVAFSVYSDFPTYKSGVYKHTTGSYLGGHAVRLVGWGELNGEKYWKIANSWNTGWGMNGYFLIARGVDECGIEDGGAAGSPRKQQ